ncbi:hypothetical protein M431DRAFT_113749, partial [Trichoderma harzianum CBS 226.95]
MTAPVPAVTAVPLPPILVADPLKRGARNGPRPPGAQASTLPPPPPAAVQPLPPLPNISTAASRSAIPSPLPPGSR